LILVVSILGSTIKNTTKASYDAIFLDALGTGNAPAHPATPEFPRDARPLLSGRASRLALNTANVLGHCASHHQYLHTSGTGR